MKLKVELNGTDKNPYEQMGLTQNPFPQTGKAEWDEACLRIQKLGGPPIPADRAEAYIRETLAGFTQEFVELCVRNYKPGIYVKFYVTF